jgi:predicted glutamine amidotransferase
MCKVAGVTKVTDQNRQDVWLFMIILGEYMSRFNNDGLGYAAFDKSGNLFGERWLVNKTAFSDFSMVKNLTPVMIDQMYSHFGPVNKDQATSIILHTRMATCEKNIHNTHPFVNNIDNPTSVIIHNGVIGNDDMFEKKYSTCDSEVLVHLYDQLKVAKNLENIQGLTEQLIGWYTVLALSKDNQGTPILDVFTDAPRLHSYYIQEFDTRVYSTSFADIESTAREFGVTLSRYEAVKADTAFRVNCATGEVVQKVSSTGRFQYDKGGNIVVAEGNFDRPDFLRKFLGRK